MKVNENHSEKLTESNLFNLGEYTYITFIESEIYDLSNKEDIQFLKEFTSGGQSLINTVGDKYRINFVGEVITPTNRYFSMPKNMSFDETSAQLIKQVLLKYRKDKNGKNLVLSKSGSYTAERVYFDKLKNYYLDYLTYEFIYPLQRTKIHSNSPISGAKISVFDTIRNRKRYGTGITYTTKDVKNSDDWILDDIYLYTLLELVQRLSHDGSTISSEDGAGIERMTKYLKEEGYTFNELRNGKIFSNTTQQELLDLSHTDSVIKKIKECQIGIIHTPIKNVLLEYYGNKQKAASNSTVNVIFTNDFKRVWELILQDALGSIDIDEFSKVSHKSEINFVDKFNKFEIVEKFIPTAELAKYTHLPTNPRSDKEPAEWIEKRGRGGRNFLCKRGRKLIPDIFVMVDKDKKFIGDAKYYRDPSNSNYDKEFYIYNDAQENLYPMVIFAVPDQSNVDVAVVPQNGYRRAALDNGVRELILITVNITTVINDAIKIEKKVLNKSISLITKYTRKSGWQG